MVISRFILFQSHLCETINDYPSLNCILLRHPLAKEMIATDMIQILVGSAISSSNILMDYIQTLIVFIMNTELRRITCNYNATNIEFCTYDYFDEVASLPFSFVLPTHFGNK